MIKIKGQLPIFQSQSKAQKGRFFSFFDFIGIVNKESKLNIDIWISISELFIPTFCEINRRIYLAEGINGRQEEYQRYLKAGLEPSKIQYWINSICLDGYFYEFDATDDALIYLGEKVKLGWELKLNRDFPSRRFEVKLIKDDSVGDFVITFFEST